jgi:hypothetical protein
MKPDREKMPIILRRTERGLEPRSRLAADALAQYALHSDVEISIKKRRSAPQLRLYWAMLHNVVEATGAFPDAERLHEALKLDLGFVTPMKLLDGRTVYVPDSAAMSKMDAAEFRRFFDAVAKRLAEVCGFDPLAHEAAA